MVVHHDGGDSHAPGLGMAVLAISAKGGLGIVGNDCAENIGGGVVRNDDRRTNSVSPEVGIPFGGVARRPSLPLLVREGIRNTSVEIA